MKSFFVLAISLAISGSISAAGQKPTATAELAAAENRWLQHENDPDALQSILASDFIHVLPSGFITKDQQINYLRQHPSREDFDRHFENLRIRVYGETGVVNGIVVATDKTGAVVRKTLFTDVFVIRDGQWKAVNAQELPIGSR